MEQTIMIFGGGLNQLSLIKAAKELHLKSVVLDPNSNAEGKTLADYFYSVPGDDYDTTKIIALKHEVAGIITGQMEKPLRLMAKLACDLGLIFHPPEVVERSLNKYLMKTAFLAHQVPCAKGKLIPAHEPITQNIISDLTFPLIVKPKDAFSSRGVYKIEKFEEIEQYLLETRAFSSNGDILIEEFLEGPEYSIESITYHGETNIIQYTEKFITPFPNTVEMGHLQPADLTDSQKEQIAYVVKHGITALGIDNSAAHTEVKLTSSGPKIIEIGARLGGDFISSYLTLASCGISMDKAAIQVALGREPNLMPTQKNYSYIKYLELKTGKTVQEVQDWSEINTADNIIFAYISITHGETVQKITHSALRPGFIIVNGKTREEALKLGQYYSIELQRKIILH